MACVAGDSAEYERDFQELPIQASKAAVLDLLKTNQMVIVIGETGSGKTTQLPQYVLDSGLLGDDRMCAVTQPRRVAAQVRQM
jgi:HrpA-like RNA helicase